MVSSTQSKARGYSEVLTTGVRVNVESMYLRRQSQPESERYVFIYVVKITNESDKTIQLLDRHWVITDAYGGTEEDGIAFNLVSPHGAASLSLKPLAA